MDTQALSNGFLALGTVASVFLLILAILWILVPFAVFGIKPLLRALIAEQRRTYESLAAISQQLHNAQVRDAELTRVPLVDRETTTTVVRPVPATDTRY